MVRGIIRPNGYSAHHHGALSFYTEVPRHFVVDEKAERVIDEPRLGAPKPRETLAEYAARIQGKPLVLTSAAYAELQAKNGGPIVIEPVGGEAGMPDRSEMERELRRASDEIDRRGQRISELEEAADRGRTEIERLHARNDELKSQAEQLGATLQRAEADIANARTRIADLEQQLAASKAQPTTTGEKPAAGEKPAKK